MTLLELGQELMELRLRVEFGEASEEEIEFLKDQRDYLNELSQQYWEK